jgi:amidase
VTQSYHVPSPRSSTAYLDIATQANLVRHGEANRKELLERVLADISILDHDGLGQGDRATSRLGAFIALADAAAFPPNGNGEDGPLAGVTIGVKDNCDTTDLPTTAGSLVLGEVPAPPTDAGIVWRLRQAGATIVGKTNLSEWSNFRSLRSTSGWSGAGGQCRNPFVLDRSPGGSSSGSGAAVAAGLVPAAIGTETNGSVMCPAAVNGIVGIKPTVGATSRAGVIPISPTQDSVGVLARSMADARTVLACIVGPDANDSATRVGALDVAALAHRTRRVPDQIRLGIASASLMGYDPAIDNCFMGAIMELKRAGVVIVEQVDGANRSLAIDNDAQDLVLRYEFRRSLEHYLRQRGAAGHDTIAAIQRRHLELAEQELAIFGQERFDEVIESPGPDEAQYQRARDALNVAAQRRIDEIMSEHALDGIVAPTMGTAWKIDYVAGDVVSGDGYGAAAVAGYPSISLPIGLYRGLPVGMTLFSQAWTDVALCDVASTVEEILGVDLRPQFLPTLETSPLPWLNDR